MKEAGEKQGNAIKLKGVSCPHCEHVNDADKITCRRCGTHLYVSCNKCGARNPRVRSSCHECRQRLHRSFWSRVDRRVGQMTRGRVKIAHIILLIVSVLFVYKVIVFFSEYQAPPLQ